MNVLIACEESQRVCAAFRAKGHNAYSCDIIEPSGGHPEWHIQDDVLKILNPVKRHREVQCDDEFIEIDEKSISFITLDGKMHEIEQWDLIIAHPPCTYLTISGNRWFKPEYGEKAIERIKLKEETYDFFMKFVDAECDKIAIENPIGYVNSHYRKPDQIIQPYYFAESADSEDNQTKKTCLWLKGLPKLTYEIKFSPKQYKMSNGKTEAPWHYETWKISNKKERSKMRSKTFYGIAKAMAEQWG